MQTLDVQLSTGVTLTVPASLKSITTYALLEQEAWFEKEMEFLRCWLQPGMTAIDIGAHLGVYSLPMARLVGPTGQVFAYEPSSQTRAYLERSRALNDASALQIFPFALSDSAREGRIAFGFSSELNTLGEGGDGETVRITSLDVEEDERGWMAPDFIKIDAEGEEERVIAGGRAFFARHSPLVMMEVQMDGTFNEQLRSLMPTLGYRVYRQLGGAAILVPDNPGQTLDPYELNLFAAKPDRAADLARRGLLTEDIPTWTPGKTDIQDAEILWQRQKFAFLSDVFKFDKTTTDPAYSAALAGYAAWQDLNRPAAVRCGALAFSFKILQALCLAEPNTARLSTFVRVALDWGARNESVAALRQLIFSFNSGAVQITEPFWPANRRFDEISPHQQPADWFMAAVAEQFEKSAHFSSEFFGLSPALDWLCGTPFASPEMERRRLLFPANNGIVTKVTDRLFRPAPDHLNADLWRTGKIPGILGVS